MVDLSSIVSSLIKPVLKFQCQTPKVEGAYKIPGLTAPVEIFRDQVGVPHIYAKDAHDVFLAQGFIHAQDRLWQMEFNRRLIAGRLSEIFGQLTVPVDRWMRTLTMRRVAEYEVSLYNQETSLLLQAYTDGVNAFIHQGSLPIEFKLLRHHPQPWIIADSLAWVKMMAWTLSVNWEMELTRAKLLEKFGPQLASELEIHHLDRWHYTIPPGSDFSHLDVSALERARLARPFTGPSPYAGLGSNNWAVSGDRTSTGKPILANDMHLQMTIPSIWYENHLVCEDFDITGITFPGILGIVSGHNGHVAWGFTNGFPDVQDLYMERIRRSQSGAVQVEYNGRWEEAQILHENIAVKGSQDVVEQVVITRHGPVINSLSPDFIGDSPLSLRWTALDPDTMLQALPDMFRAKNCHQFHQALCHWTTPVQNVVHADIDGNIAFTWPGKIPIRSKGDGRLPVPGWTDEYEWIGYVPFELLPHLTNPAQGYIATANNRTFGDDFPVDIPIQSISGDRLQRIHELIESQEIIDISYIQTMHFDQVSTSAREVARHFRELKSKDGDSELFRAALESLQNWDGTLSAGSLAAALYQSFIRHSVSLMITHKLHQLHPSAPPEENLDLAMRFMGKGPTPVLMEAGVFGEFYLPWLTCQLEQPDSHWFNLGNGERREDVMKLALHAAVDELSARLGPKIEDWSWGRIHQFTFQHLMGTNKLVASFFNRGPIPLGGDQTTVWATGSSNFDFNNEHVVGPPFRMIVDLGDLNNSWSILTPGQSGVPTSPHYDDQIVPWLKQGYHRMLYDRDVVRKAATHRLKLTPG